MAVQTICRLMLSLKCINDPKRASRIAGEFVGVDLIWRDVPHILTMMILAGVIVDLVQFAIKCGRRVAGPSCSNFSNHVAEPIVR